MTVAHPDNSDKQEVTTKGSRRSFFNRIWVLLASLAFAEMTWLGFSTFSFRRKRQREDNDEQIVVVGKTEDFRPNTVTAIPQGQFYMACLEDGSFLALSRTCTHLGCAVPWDEQRHRFVCPCHGSTFSLTGEVLTAPATRPLDTYPVRIDDGIIKVNIATPLKRERFDSAQAVRLP